MRNRRFGRVRWKDIPWRELDDFREACHLSGLSGLPADRATTERTITEFYARLGMPAPAFVWFDGPLSCVLAAHACNAECRKRLGTPIRSLVEVVLWASWVLDIERAIAAEVPIDLEAWRRVLAHRIEPEADVMTTMEEERQALLSSNVGRLLGAQIHYSMHHGIGKLNGERWKGLGEEYWSRFESHLRDRLGIDFTRPISGQRVPEIRGFWSGERQAWIAQYLGYEYAGVEFAPNARAMLAQWQTLNASAGWWFPFEHAVLCSERLLVHRDQDGRMHGTRGPAIECRDGYDLEGAYFYWHGTRVPANWINRPESIDPWGPLTWPDSERRRAAAEILGWRRLFERLPMRVIEADSDPQIGTLLECHLPNVGPARFLRVRCGTGREFGIRVPREVTSARQANAWSYGLESDEYQPEIRT